MITNPSEQTDQLTCRSCDQADVQCHTGIDGRILLGPVDVFCHLAGGSQVFDFEQSPHPLWCPKLTQSYLCKNLLDGVPL